MSCLLIANERLVSGLSWVYLMRVRELTQNNLLIGNITRGAPG
jgi:hypothetical protein